MNKAHGYGFLQQQTNKKGNICPTAQGKEKLVAYLAWTFHITATEQINICVRPHSALNVSITLDDTAPYPEN